MDIDIQTYRKKVDELCKKIKSLPPESHLDLLKMTNNLTKLVDMMSKESVLCRQQRKVSYDFSTMSAQFDELYTEIDMYITYAALVI